MPRNSRHMSSVALFDDSSLSRKVPANTSHGQARGPPRPHRRVAMVERIKPRSLRRERSGRARRAGRPSFSLSLDQLVLRFVSDRRLLRR